MGKGKYSSYNNSNDKQAQALGLAKTPSNVNVNIDALSKLALPVSLNQYYLPFIDNVKDCLLFLDRFAADDDSIARLLKVYNGDKAFNKLSDKLDLDLLAEKADFSRGELRRLINSTLDVLGDEEAMMLLRVNKRHLVKKSLEIALTDKHPDSFEERRSLMQYYGFHPIPKGSQVSINIDKSQSLIQQNNSNNTINSLPSFASTISESEKIASQQVKELIKEDPGQVNDVEYKQLDSKPVSIPLYTDKSSIEVETELAKEDLDKMEKN